MKKCFSALVAASVIGFSSLALAGDDSGIYIGGSVGQSAIDVRVSDVSFDFNLDDNSNAYKLMLGYNFGLIPLVDLAVEADYRDFGTFKSGRDVSSDITAVDIYGLAGINFGLIGLFAKVGYSDADLDQMIGREKFTASESSNTFGLGARVQLGSFAVRAEYEEFDLDDVDDLNMWSIGATVTF